MSKKTAPSLADPGPVAPDPSDRRSPIQRDSDEHDAQILALLKSEQVSGGVISLHRRAVGETSFGYLGEMPPETFSKENVKVVFGGGDYRAQAKNGTRNILRTWEFKIDYRIPALFPGVVDRSQKDTTDLPAIIAALKSAMPPPPPPRDDTLLLTLIKSQGEMVLALMNRPQSDPNAALVAQLAALAGEVKELKASRESGGRRGNGLRDALEDFHALQELSGGGAGATSVAPAADRTSELIKALAPALVPMISRMLGGQPDPAGPVPDTKLQPLLASPDQLNPAPELPAATELPADPMNPLVSVYKNQIRNLAVKAAQKNREPMEWVRHKLDDIPENFHGVLFKIANAPDWFAQIFAGDPAAQPVFPWLLSMRNAILAFWVVADVSAASQESPRPDPAKYSADLLNRSTEDFHDALWFLVEPEQWSKLFSDSECDADFAELVRVELEKLMGGENDDTEEAPGKIVDIAPADPAPKKKTKP